MNTLSVSSYSVREQLGPVTFDFVDPDGNDRHIDLPYPKLLSLPEFPARVRNAFGVDAVEMVAFQFAGLDDPEIDRFATALVSTGVRLVSVAIDVGDLLEADNAKRAVDIALTKEWIDRFTAMGTQFVRVNPGSPLSTHHSDKAPAHLVDALAELGAFAEQQGTRLLVENHAGSSSDPAWMGNLLDVVGRDACGLLLDLGNFDVLTTALMPIFFAGATDRSSGPVDLADALASIDLTSVYEGIDALAGYAELVSLKAHYVSDDGAVGPVDLVRALGILDAHGYTGPLSVEYEGNAGDPWANIARVLDVARSAMTEQAH